MDATLYSGKRINEFKYIYIYIIRLFSKNKLTKRKQMKTNEQSQTYMGQYQVFQHVYKWAHPKRREKNG